MEVTDADLTREPEDHRPFITTTQGLRGHFAVLMFWDDDGGFWDVWQSGIGSFSSAEGAAREGRDWAMAEGLEFHQ